MIKPLLLKGLIEFIGTFILVSVVLTAAPKEYGPIAIGLTLATMIYFGSWISTGCFNPAVSLGAYLNDGIDSKELLFYIIVQMLAALCAYYFYKVNKKFFKQLN